MKTGVYQTALRVLAYRGGGWGNDLSPKTYETPAWLVAERRSPWYDLRARVRYADGACEWLPFSHVRLDPDAWDLPIHLRIPAGPRS